MRTRDEREKFERLLLSFLAKVYQPAENHQEHSSIITIYYDYSRDLWNNGYFKLRSKMVMV